VTNQTQSTKGLDKQGYITTPYSVSKIQPEFTAVVDHTISTLVASFGERLHSIYLYGSIGRGDATPYCSDLDMSVVFTSKVSDKDVLVLKHLSEDIAAKHTVITKLDFDPGEHSQIKQPSELYRWQFWLKHCCCCLWGDDLSKEFTQHKPSFDIAVGLNEDLSNAYQSFLSQTANSQQVKSISKKILRAAYLLIAPQDNTWHHNLDDMYISSLPYYPRYQEELKTIFALTQNAQTGSTLSLYSCHRFITNIANQLLGSESIDSDPTA
jgi:predicted nucleotidyltransferase